MVKIRRVAFVCCCFTAGMVLAHNIGFSEKDSAGGSLDVGVGRVGYGGSLVDCDTYVLSSLRCEPETTGIIELKEEEYAGITAYGVGRWIVDLTLPASIRFLQCGAFLAARDLKSLRFLSDAPAVLSSSITVSGIGLSSTSSIITPGLFDGTPQDMVVYVPQGSIGWNGPGSTTLPEFWCGRRIKYYGSSSGGGGSGFVTVLTEVKGGAVVVPESWSASYPTYKEKFGEDVPKSLICKTGKKDWQGQDMCVWQDYIAGTDPTNPDDMFTASISFEDGKPHITWTPELTAAQKGIRKYSIYAKEKISDVEWTDVTMFDDEGRANFNFFKVTVEMK